MKEKTPEYKLRDAASESDAVEFAEWISKNGYDKRFTSKWTPIGGERIFKPALTTNELYVLFKQSKTNSDGK